jgi:ATP-dependent Clp protease ATP-binding subunit ClpB
MRKNPHRVLLFDEIEKAHPDVFNLFLQILSDGRLTDNVGRTVSFADSIIIMTTNIGQPHFLDQSIDFEEAKKRANGDLNNTYRSEFLNRFNGRQNIVCFNRLELDSIEKIVRREIANLNKAYGDQGVTIKMADSELKAFCAAKYDPAIGARGLPGFIESTIEPKIARSILENPDLHGKMLVRFDVASDSFVIDPPKPAEAAAPANQNSASASFRQAEKKGVAP